jgi:MFS family permease
LVLLIREPKRDEAQIAESGHADPANASIVAVPFVKYAAALLTTPSAILLLLAFCAANSVAGVVYGWMPTFLHEKFEVSIANAGWIATVGVQVPSMIGALTGGYLADLWSSRRAGGRIAIQATGAFLGVPFIYLSGQSNSYTIFLIALVGFGFCKGLYDANIWPSLYDVTPAARRASTLGMGNMIGWGASALLTTLIGRWADQGISMSTTIGATCVLYVAAALMLAAAGFIFAPRDVAKMREFDVKVDADSQGAVHP